MRRGLISLLVLVACDARTSRPPAAGSTGASAGGAATHPGAVAGPPLSAEAPAEATAWREGDAALILWQGRWWRGRILAVRGPDRYYIHYDGWETRWDEEVPASRLAPIEVEAR